MDSTPTPAVPPPTPTTRRRKFLWGTLVVFALLPICWAGAILVLYFTWSSSANNEAALTLFAAVIALALVAWVVRRGLRRNSPARSGWLWFWVAATIASAALVVFAYLGFLKIKESSRRRSIESNLFQLAAAEGQFSLEEGYRVFVNYDELVGRGRAINTVNPISGEDYRALFPHRILSPFILTLPGKKPVVVARYESADPQPDGVQLTKWEDGRRYETTWRGGVPHGVFRAFYPDGVLWSEATFAHGRLAGPAWLYTHDGRKFDELKEGPTAVAAIAASLTAASSGSRDRGEQKLRGGDFAGANADLTEAIAANALDPALRQLRADARKHLGDLDGAIADSVVAEGFPAGNPLNFRLPPQLKELVIARCRQRLQSGDAAGAADDSRAVAQSALWNAEWKPRNPDPLVAITELTEAIELAPFAELYQARADARRRQRDYQVAEVDYTRALALAEQGVMLIPANQHINGAIWRYQRGHVRRWLGNLAGAAEDFRAALPALGTGGIINQGDAAAWLFLVQCEQGRRAEAVKELAALDKSGWWEVHRQLVQLLLGEITEAQLDAAVAKSNQDGDRLKASLYAGLLRRLAGDEAGALERFRAAVRYKDHDELPGEAARNALERR